MGALCAPWISRLPDNLPTVGVRGYLLTFAVWNVYSTGGKGTPHFD
jgi:hypothetical protein